MRLVRLLSSPVMVVALLVCSLAAQAGPITYIYDGIGTGSLDNSPFTNAAFTITADADTNNITSWPSASGGPQNTHLSTQIDIAGLGSFTITTPSHSWISATSGWGGLGENLGLNWITFLEPALIDYGLDTQIGPIVELYPLHVNQFGNVATTGGALTFGSINPVSFTAIPEPSTAVLVACGLAALALRRRLAA